MRRRLKRKTNSSRLGLEVSASEAVIDAECPAFEVGEHAMGPGQDQVRCHGPDDVRVVADAGGAPIARPAIGLHHGHGGDMRPDNGAQAVGRIVIERRQPDAAGPGLLDLHGAGDQHLST